MQLLNGFFSSARRGLLLFLHRDVNICSSPKPNLPTKRRGYYLSFLLPPLRLLNSTAFSRRRRFGINLDSSTENSNKYLYYIIYAKYIHSFIMENRYFSTSLKGKLEYFKERNIKGSINRNYQIYQLHLRED